MHRTAAIASTVSLHIILFVGQRKQIRITCKFMILVLIACAPKAYFNLSIFLFTQMCFACWVFLRAFQNNLSSQTLMSGLIWIQPVCTESELILVPLSASPTSFYGNIFVPTKSSREKRDCMQTNAQTSLIIRAVCSALCRSLSG